MGMVPTGSCLNTWSLIAETDWEGLGGVVFGIGVTFLEEVCHCAWALRFQKPMPGSVSLLRPMDQDVKLSTTSPTPCISG